MPISYDTSASVMQIPEPYSDRPVLLWATLGDDFQLNENVYFKNPKNKVLTASRFRVINCRVDLTDVDGTAIVYVNENGDQVTYFANYNGWHPIIGWGIISTADGIDATTLQVGI